MATEIIKHQKGFVLSYYQNAREVKLVPEKDNISTNSREGMPSGYSNSAAYSDLILNRGELLALAHEIKNPLTNIALSLAYLKDENSDPERSQYFDIINRSTKRINDLVNGLLASTAQGFTKESCYLNDLVVETLELAFDRITLKKLTIQKNFASEKCIIEIDKPRFKMALLNIIVNAIEAMKTGEGNLSLETKVRNNTCEIIIRDNGAGIKKENISRLCDPYYSSKKTGTGIGLTVAKQVFDGHNAIMAVQSEVGKGTSFTIKIPRF